MDHKNIIRAVDKIEEQLETINLIIFFLSVSSKDMSPETQGQLASILKTCTINIKEAIIFLGY